jgi:hypothetical protein
MVCHTSDEADKSPRGCVTPFAPSKINSSPLNLSIKNFSSVEVSRLRSGVLTVNMGPHFGLSFSWWSCCNCTREVNEAWVSDWCPDCNHTKCEECHNLGHHCSQCRRKEGINGLSRIYDPGSTATDAGTSERSSCSYLIMHHLRAKGRHLAIFLDNYLITDACADSGSEVNCIPLSLQRNWESEFQWTNACSIFQSKVESCSQLELQ